MAGATTAQIMDVARHRDPSACGVIHAASCSDPLLSKLFEAQKCRAISRVTPYEGGQ
jgi:hypothetical protein